MKGTRAFLAVLVFLIVAGLGIWLVPGMSDFPVSRLQAGLLVGFGLLVGGYGTMVGAGGGFLIVPMLLLAWHMPPAQAAGTSLFVVFLNATAGSWSYAKQGRVDYRSGFWMAAATLPGSVAGAFLARYFTGPTFNVIFATLLMAIAALLIWRPVNVDVAPARVAAGTGRWWEMHRELTDKTGHHFAYQYDLRIGLAISFVVGFLSSILGIGGGIIHVPALIYLLGFPAHLAAATSHFILAISAAVGSGTHISLGHVLFGPATLMGIGVVAGAQVGAHYARRMKSSLTVRLLAIALIVVAVRLLIK